MRAGSSKLVVILGGGIAGLCTAWYALRRGMRVVVLERGGPDHAGCSLGNAGMIVPSHLVPLAAPGMVQTGLRMMMNRESPFSIRPRLSADLGRWAWQFWRASNPEHVKRSMPLLHDLHLASRACYGEMSEEWGDSFGLQRRGLLMLFRTQDALEEERRLADDAGTLGQDAKMLTPEETAKVEPGLTMDIAGAVYYPQDCHLNPGALMRSLTERVQREGGTICYGAEVTGWGAAGDTVRSVRVPGGAVAGDEFVVAAGAWSAPILRELNLRMPLQAGKGYSMTLEQPRENPSICAILSEARVAVTPMGSSLRVAGTMEIAGNDLRVNAARVRGIVHAACAYLPSFKPEDFHGAPVWSGLRPCSPDGLPYVGRFRRFRNLSACSGHAMMGISLGPISGMTVAGILAGESPQIDISLLAPDRFD